MKKAKIDASAFLLALIVLLVIGGVAALLFTMRQDPLKESFSDDRVITTLFIVEKDRKPLCSLVLLYYPPTKRGAIFDIPGNVGLIIQQFDRVDRIDSVYSPQRPGAYSGEVGGLLGIDIDSCMIFTMENLGRIVDLIEGVDVYIPGGIEIYDEDPPSLFPAGLVRLDGEKAMAFLSLELEGEDPSAPVSRREELFLGFLRRLGEENAFLNSKPVSKVYQNFIRSDINVRTRTQLMDELTGLNTDRLQIQTVAGVTREVSGQTLLIPSLDGSLIKDVVRQSLASLTRQAEGVEGDRVFTVEILNGTLTTGLAARTSELLQGFGYDVLSVGNADRSDYESTEIIDHVGLESIVKNLGDIIRCSNTRTEITKREEFDISSVEYQADFTLILGRDFNGRYVTNR